MNDRSPALAPQRVRHPIVFRLLEVISATPLTPHLQRIVLGGEALQGFVSSGFDDHVKLVLPAPGEARPPEPVSSAEGLRFAPDLPKPTMRDYTPRAFDADALTLTIDFALHDAGPATLWAKRAQAGDQIGIAGPRGSLIVPTGFDCHMLVGDDTAIPAIARRLSELPAGARAEVFIEVGSAADEVALSSEAAVDLRWLHRGDTSAGTSRLLPEALRQARRPEGTCYAWVACETRVAKAVRDVLIHDLGLDSAYVKASGYWRSGADGVHDSVDAESP